MTAVGAGANPLYLGAELPVDDLLSTMEITGAAVLALSIVSLPASQAERTVSALRGGLPGTVHLWIGGSGAQSMPEHAGVEVIKDLDSLETRVALLSLEGPSTKRNGA